MWLKDMTSCFKLKGWVKLHMAFIVASCDGIDLATFVLSGTKMCGRSSCVLHTHQPETARRFFMVGIQSREIDRKIDR